MNRIPIKKLFQEGNTGQKVSVYGWIRSRRESKSVAFIALNDGSTQETLQVVVPSEAAAFNELHRCNTGAAIKATGLLKDSPAKGQKYEVEATDIEVLGEADPDTYPLQKKGHTLEFLRDIGHLRSRSNTFGAVFRLRNVLSSAVHEFFQERGFMWVHTPIITASDCEGAGDQFTVTTLDMEKLAKSNNGDLDFSNDFFGKHAYLTVSGQLEAEFLSMSMGDVYTFGPTFRAENSNTSRHLSEFWMIEPEMAFADINDDMQLAEDFIRYLCKKALTECETEIAFFQKFYKNTSAAELQAIVEKPFVRITYTDAVKELVKSESRFEYPVEWGLDLQSEHERFLTDKVFKGPVTVVDYPRDIKAFYMRQNNDGKTVAAMDVLVPKVGEIIGGSQREERLDVLEKRMTELAIPLDEMQWYLDLRRYGSAPHAGFGLGFERLVQYVSGMPNIRDVIPCPRAPQLIKF